eukprot:1161921-Pelagomonas_calceolata.AAC.4
MPRHGRRYEGAPGASCCSAGCGDRRARPRAAAVGSAAAGTAGIGAGEQRGRRRRRRRRRWLVAPAQRYCM